MDRNSFAQGGLQKTQGVDWDAIGGLKKTTAPKAAAQPINWEEMLADAPTTSSTSPGGGIDWDGMLSDEPNAIKNPMRLPSIPEYKPNYANVSDAPPQPYGHDPALFEPLKPSRGALFDWLFPNSKAIGGLQESAPQAEQPSSSGGVDWNAIGGLSESPGKSESMQLPAFKQTYVNALDPGPYEYDPSLFEPKQTSPNSFDLGATISEFQQDPQLASANAVIGAPYGLMLGDALGTIGGFVPRQIEHLARGDWSNQSGMVGALTESSTPLTDWVFPNRHAQEYREQMQNLGGEAFMPGAFRAGGMVAQAALPAGSAAQAGTLGKAALTGALENAGLSAVSNIGEQMAERGTVAPGELLAATAIGTGLGAGAGTAGHYLNRLFGRASKTAAETVDDGIPFETTSVPFSPSPQATDRLSALEGFSPDTNGSTSDDLLERLAAAERAMESKYGSVLRGSSSESPVQGSIQNSILPDRISSPRPSIQEMFFGDSNVPKGRNVLPQVAGGMIAAGQVPDEQKGDPWAVARAVGAGALLGAGGYKAFQHAPQIGEVASKAIKFASRDRYDTYVGNIFEDTVQRISHLDDALNTDLSGMVWRHMGTVHKENFGVAIDPDLRAHTLDLLRKKDTRAFQKLNLTN
ncbi:MAG: hypothetical protein K2X93_13005 [Candidatus Obscuribacterales bacterium]|nr:hypothetical protein [Candidatus Obscuribacterales bacterium]